MGEGVDQGEKKQRHFEKQETIRERGNILKSVDIL